jgi:hypothetical protein
VDPGSMSAGQVGRSTDRSRPGLAMPAGGQCDGAPQGRQTRGKGGRGRGSGGPEAHPESSWLVRDGRGGQKQRQHWR